ncbi:DMT family transporter [Pelolinea submarina]|uniref:Drug/metabolite transporter (DMT)-like permease n=2 Tax=Pelolinea submarina TaxID=913107 RepID=A0A3E0AFP7_9CHLR|nr:DMT family transporter [Pelolinea submarina]REG10443.1 drug/metabolite transporter (DMT)-like permease [Pelolinea submarina]
MKNTRGYIALFIAITIWGTAFMITKLVLGVIGPLLLTEIRLVIAFLTMAPFAARQGFRLKDIFNRDIMLFALTGTTLYYGLENTGMVYTSVSSTALILAIIPALTTVLAVVVLKERINRTQLVGLVLVTVGVMLVGLQQNPDVRSPHPLLGNLLVFLSALSWAVYTIQGRIMARKRSALVMAAASIGAAILQLLPFSLWETANQGLPQMNLMAVLGIFYLAIVSSGLTTILWNEALHYLPASVASPIVNLSSVIGLAGAFLLGEKPPLIQIVGGAMALGGVLLSSRSASDEQPEA